MFVCTAAVTGLRRALQLLQLVYNKTAPPHFMHWVKSRWSDPSRQIILILVYICSGNKTEEG